jgi:cyclopropane fatty-acyl-phospholipid synthase-like methyltransferase
MSFYHDKKTVNEYIKMAADSDASLLIESLRNHLEKDKKVLELGMGPGKDLDQLSKYFQVTGSDFSPVFLDIYRKKHPQADLLQLDIRDLNTTRKFDGLYSNKVLVHFPPEDLPFIFNRSSRLLNKGGVVLHSFLRGDGEESVEGVNSYYYQPGLVEAIMIEEKYKILEQCIYAEESQRDSFFIVAEYRG